MATRFKPIRTDYAGVTFRSKTEAQLALALNVSDRDWEYEPPWLAKDGCQPPDFVVTEIYNNKTVMTLIECKPSEPTETYKSELVGRYQDWSAIIPCSTCLELHVVSFYTMQFAVWGWIACEDYWTKLEYPSSNYLDLTYEQLDYLKNRRFDLKNN